MRLRQVYVSLTPSERRVCIWPLTDADNGNTGTFDGPSASADPSAIPSGSLSAEQPAESNTGETFTPKQPEEGSETPVGSEELGVNDEGEENGAGDGNDGGEGGDGDA